MKMTEPQLKQKVKKIANYKGCDPQEIYKKLFFERFLVRLAKSEVSDKLLFKGGNLLGLSLTPKKRLLPKKEVKWKSSMWPSGRAPRL